MQVTKEPTLPQSHLHLLTARLRGPKLVLCTSVEDEMTPTTSIPQSLKSERQRPGKGRRRPLP
jgi:hypothetical protein